MALRKPRMTREEFFPWAEAQDARYEFDGFEPVPITGGTLGHSQITVNILVALRARLKGSEWTTLGPDAGVATIGDTIRYPDALVTRGRFSAEDRIVPDVVVIFEVLSKTSGAMDRIIKLREYQAVPSILRYVIVERTLIGLTVLSRARGTDPWTAGTLTSGEALAIPEVGIEIPVDELYEGTDLSREDEETD